MLKKHYRLGIDMGSSSIGWAIILLDEDNEPCGVEKMGVRIFPDGREDKTPTPLSVKRRGFRGARRNHDRFLQRMRNLLDVLDKHGLLPKDQEERKSVFAQDPYRLRALALDQKLEISEFARTLFHLAKRRGFKSNRKTDDPDATTKFMTAIENLHDKLQQGNARTIGEYLYKKQTLSPNEHTKGAIRFRYDSKLYTEDELIFPHRDMVISEFELIWEAQSKYHPELINSLKEEIYHAIFYQRPLKPTVKGKCIFEPEEFRAPKAHPLFQEFRILQDVNNLLVEEIADQSYRPLTAEERSKIIDVLMNSKESKLSSLRNKLFGKNKEYYKFNYETNNRDKLLGNQTNCAFIKKKDSPLPKYWNSLSHEQQEFLVELLCSDLDEQDLSDSLTKICESSEIVEALLYMKLPTDFCNVSIKALKKIVPFLRQGYIYSDACSRAGYNHSEKWNGVVYHNADLPYYGELLKHSVLPLARPSYDLDADVHGKINNPTVHIALNQIRKIINALEKVYGPPAQIVIELARELKMNKTDKEEFDKRQRNQATANERIAKELKHFKIDNNYENRTRFKLWEELSNDPLERRCVYTGRIIPIEKLFSPEFEIEHILPKSRTFDDSIPNKTISYYAANRYKGEHSPYEAFGQSNDNYDWEAIVNRASTLPENKRRRFLKDSMERYSDEKEVLARMLNDTRYMSRVAKEYLQYVVGERNIWVVNGQQTSMLRGKWGLNRILNEDGSGTKNRADHRHHAIDAFVIGMMGHSTVNRLSTAVKQSRDRYLEKMADPYPGFDHKDLERKVHNIMVSYKPDQINPVKLRKRNQTAGPLLKDTAYGFVGPNPKNPQMYLYSERVAVTEIKLSDIERIIDPVIKELLKKQIASISDAKLLKTSLADWSKKTGIKKVKMLFNANPDTMIHVYDKSGKIYKCYASGENLFTDIYCIKPWDKSGKWSMEIVTSYNAHQLDFTPKWKQEYPMAKLIMRLFKNDVVCVDSEQGRQYRRVKKMSPGRVYLRDLNIAKRDKEERDDGESFSVSRLQTLNARKAGIDAIGRAFDPYVGDTNASTGDQS
ncbi:MAG: type II CRISPR RNA-guided endonuclease Cas9 [Candidatus Cloacimonetes bacterium]|jgi:CRISPR-associated endonuclease Csn1|nr:type II CRISPR RNA-guided endonuclease Cas9 [Candidatus Cloacimonadota bacterium]MDD3097965.1 type II CRISPR RNA-guided endonuclease Cas9 [Candidatus Cloacimonadota bacterium]